MLLLYSFFYRYEFSGQFPQYNPPVGISPEFAYQQPLYQPYPLHFTDQRRMSLGVAGDLPYCIPTFITPTTLSPPTRTGSLDLSRDNRTRSLDLSRDTRTGSLDLSRDKNANITSHSPVDNRKDSKHNFDNRTPPTKRSSDDEKGMNFSHRSLLYLLWYKNC